MNKEKKESIKKTLSVLKEITKTNQKLLTQLFSLLENPTESFSSNELKEIPKWTKITMDLTSSILNFQSRLEAKLMKLEAKSTQKLENRIKREDINKRD